MTEIVVSHEFNVGEVYEGGTHLNTLCINKMLSLFTYQQGELEGSKLYTELLESAKKFFTETISNASR